MKPPPVIGNARVIEYAAVGEAVFTGTPQLYVNGVPLGAVPSLAICESFTGDELFLLHCDEDWAVRGIQAWKKSDGADNGSVEEIKSRTEKYYAGISSQWIAHDASFEDAKAYQAHQLVDVHCSFCTRTMFDVDSLIEGHAGARICNLCVTSFREEMTVNQPRG